jgi:serine/threonine protein kinase
MHSVCAVKVALFIDNNRELFRKEHDIATELFAAFPTAFLRVFKYTEVENIVFSHANTMLDAKKNVYQKSDAWENTLKGLKKSNKQMWLEKKKSGAEIGSYIDTRVPGGLLYLQLGVGDLKQCIRSNNFTEEMLMQFRENVIEAIRAMHSKGIVHNDLHLGNVLVVWVDKGLKAVIHDFDKSDYSTDDDRRSNDMKTFLSHFEEAMESRTKSKLRF